MFKYTGDVYPGLELLDSKKSFFFRIYIQVISSSLINTCSQVEDCLLRLVVPPKCDRSIPGPSPKFANLCSGCGMTFLSSISLLAALFFSALSVLPAVCERDTGSVAMLSPPSTSTVATFTSPPPIVSASVSVSVVMAFSTTSFPITLLIGDRIFWSFAADLSFLFP